MRCPKPYTVGFKSDGKTLSWSPKNYDKQYATFSLPCGKCIACRLEYARQWAVRCVHEAQMHSQNCFITLTYSDTHLKSPKLDYSDFQKFVKRLRKTLDLPIGVFVTGEYGENTKRPHFHALIFGWTPSDLVYYRTTDRGDKIYTSKNLDKLWGNNDPNSRPSEIGQITFESAGYTARYAAKKLVHGKDHEHEFQPISKKSSKHAIGKKFLEKYWKNIFDSGKCFIQNSSGDVVSTAIPRYYEKWLQKNQPDAWEDYVTKLKQQRMSTAQEENENHLKKETETNDSRRLRQGLLYEPVIRRTEAEHKILIQKFNQLQKFQKN